MKAGRGAASAEAVVQISSRAMRCMGPTLSTPSGVAWSPGTEGTLLSSPKTSTTVPRTSQRQESCETWESTKKSIDDKGVAKGKCQRCPSDQTQVVMMAKTRELL